MSALVLQAVSVACLWGTLVVGVSAAQQAPVLEKMVKIEGRTEPHRIPEWLAWQSGLGVLATVKKEDYKDYFRLVLQPADAELVEKEALAQRERDDECYRAQERRQEELSAQRLTLQETVNDLKKTVVLGCRVRTLEARDSLLAALSPDAQFAVANWIDEHRANITSLVPVSDQEFYKQPR